MTEESNKMYFLKSLCALCLANDKKLTSRHNLSPSIIKIIGYVMPDHALQDSKSSCQICENCLNSLKGIRNFRQRCLQSIRIHKKYVQVLKHENESFKYPSIRITDIFNKQKCKISEDIQNVERMKSEYNYNEEIESEISETDCNDLKTGNNEQNMLEIFEMVEMPVKKEINEELVIKEELKGNSNLFEDEIPKNSEIHEMKIEEGEEGYISSNESYSELLYVPEDVLEEASEAKYRMLPAKSTLRYQRELKKFTQWKVEKKIKEIDENVMIAYFKNIGLASAWSRYSMLKSTLLVSQNVDISRFSSLCSFLKRKCRNYHPKKAATFSRNDVIKFLSEAPDQQWILQKVLLVMSIFGGCRCDELSRMMIDDVEENFEDVNPTLVVKVPVTKTGVARSFTVIENGMGINFIDIYRKYKERRPIPDGRFFLQCRKGTFTSQVLGVNSIAKIPEQIAEYLKLSDKGSFTGHSFRRTSATLLADLGADILTLKRHGSWKSNSVAESYVSASKTSKIEIA